MTRKTAPIAITLAAAGVIAATLLGTPAASADPPPAVRTAMTDVLARYETIRAALAADSTSGVRAASRAIAASAGQAHGAASGSLATSLQALQTAASRLAHAPETDLAALRGGFAELSRAVVTILSAEPALASGLHIFECPMAPGYRKWVQPSSEIQNPYMGTRMSTCGTNSEWRP